MEVRAYFYTSWSHHPSCHLAGNYCQCLSCTFIKLVTIKWKNTVSCCYKNSCLPNPTHQPPLGRKNGPHLLSAFQLCPVVLPSGRAQAVARPPAARASGKERL